MSVCLGGNDEVVVKETAIHTVSMNDDGVWRQALPLKYTRPM